MPRISVVVPMYNVERYLSDCLESLAHQTERDLEVIIVDDGSTDSGAAIAAELASRDPRFRLVQQANGGLGHARNTGADLATGDYLAFVDSDDIVVADAYRSMADSLDETGSDFATGNFHRLTVGGTRQAGMTTNAFIATRLRTHISKHPALLYDRTAWNKLFRRSFWVQHGFRWPEGVLYEDIPVTLPAHVVARTVDVLRQTVYLWRARVGDSASITQRRTEPRAIRDRTTAVDGVSRFLAEQGQDKLKQQYDRTCAEQDLKYFLQELDLATDDFRMLFLELVNDFFDRADDGVFAGLPAIDRLKWHLVRRRLMPELLEVLRFEKSGQIEWTPMLRRGRRFYGRYPYFGDERLGVPESVYRMRKDEIPLRGLIEDVWWEGSTLRLRGYAHIAFLDVRERSSTRIRLTLEENGRPESVVALSVQQVRRPDVTGSAPDSGANYDWSGFVASLPVESLRHRRAWRTGQWRLRLDVRTDGITRRRWFNETAPGRAQRPPLLTTDTAQVVATSEGGTFAVEVLTRAGQVGEVVVDGTAAELHGVVHGATLDPGEAVLRLAREDGASVVDIPVATNEPAAGQPATFVSRVPVRRLLPGTEAERAALDEGPGVRWLLFLLPDSAQPRVPVTLAPGADQPRVELDGGPEVLVRASRTGRLRVVVRSFRPEADTVRWTDDGALELAGDHRAPRDDGTELLLREGGDDAPAVPAERAVPVRREGTRFEATVPGATLAPGQWDLYARSAGGADVRVGVTSALLADLPSAAPSRAWTVLDVDDALSLRVGGETVATRGEHGR